MPAGDQWIGARARMRSTTRITPRSPRAALEPEHVPVPTRRSRRARNPLVIAGNAIFTLLILLIAGAAASPSSFGKQRFEAPGPLDRGQGRQHSARLGMRDIADLLRARRRDRPAHAIFIGGVFALKARDELKFGEYQFAKHASLRDVRRDHRRRQGGAARHHRSGRPDLRADRAAAARQRRAHRQHQRRAARGHAAAGDLPVPARHDARADDPAHAAGAAARAAGDLGAPQSPICRSRRRSSS